ncbi:trypsin-like peptidase domain-containing protein [Actinoplanes sp. NPDC000266]
MTIPDQNTPAPTPAGEHPTSTPAAHSAGWTAHGEHPTAAAGPGGWLPPGEHPTAATGQGGWLPPGEHPTGQGGWLPPGEHPTGQGGWLPPGGHPTIQGAWSPPGGNSATAGWQQYQPSPHPSQPRRRANRLALAIGGGAAALVVAAGAGFAAGWSLHPDNSASSAQSSASPVLPLVPGTGSQSGEGGLGSGSGSGLGSGSGFGSGSGSGFGAGSGADGSGSGAAGSGTTAGGATASQVAAVAAKVDPALVDITTVLGAQNAEAAGTGIVLTSDGVILTNNHVVAGATSITVTDIGNGKDYRAAVVGYDRSADIAVIKLSGASGLATATLATSATVRTGDPVVAIGNAGGTGGTPSAVGGAVTALGQSITASDESSGSSEQLTNLIQVNADIEAGDSGGPLLTTSGQVIGVDTAASAGFSYQSSGGAGYAIPIATAVKLADQIRSGESSSTVHIGATAYLGIQTTDSSDYATSGPAVLGVVTGSPAATAGLTRGDVITSVAGTRVASATALTTLLDRYHPANKVKVAWTDVSGQSHTATVTLATGPVG